MSSSQVRIKQSPNGYFIPLANVAADILSYTPTGGAGGSFLPGRFALASWAQGGTTPSEYTSTLISPSAGGILRDMGKTVISSGRTFRKVQLMTSTPNTGGVNGDANTNPVVDYLTGYIELGSGAGSVGGAGYPHAPVAYYPGLM